MSADTLYAPNPRGKPRHTDLGYSSKEKAQYTLKKIKKEPMDYQRQVATTMYYRAKHHKFQTAKTRDAMKVYKNLISKLGRKTRKAHKAHKPNRAAV